MEKNKKDFLEELFCALTLTLTSTLIENGGEGWGEEERKKREVKYERLHVAKKGGEKEEKETGEREKKKHYE